MKTNIAAKMTDTVSSTSTFDPTLPVVGVDTVRRAKTGWVVEYGGRFATKRKSLVPYSVFTRAHRGGETVMLDRGRYELVIPFLVTKDTDMALSVPQFGTLKDYIVFVGLTSESKTMKAVRV